MANDTNSSVLSTQGTPLKAIDNICSSVGPGPGPLNGSVFVASNDHPMFARPQQTSTPATRTPAPSTRRSSPQKVVPLMDLEVSEPFKRCGIMSRINGSAPRPMAASFSQDGGFLPDSQPVGATPLFPMRNTVRADLTMNELTEGDFRPVIASTQIHAGPTANSNIASQLLKLYPRFSNFENSFIDDADLSVPDNKFKPIAVSTQISPKPLTAGSGGKNLAELCPRNGDFKNSFVGQTLVGGMLASGSRNPGESGGGNPGEAGTVSVMVELSAVAEDKAVVVSESSTTCQQAASRSPSPELFDCEDAVAEKIQVSKVFPPPCSNSPLTTRSESHPCDRVETSDESKTTDSCHQVSLQPTTLARKLADRKQKAEDNTMDDPDSGDQGSVKHAKGPPVMKTSLTNESEGSAVKDLEQSCMERSCTQTQGSSVKDMEWSCTQTRRSARLSTRSRTTPLHSSRLRRRGVDFLDEIDEVFILVLFLPSL